MVEYFDERCTEFRRNNFSGVPIPEFENNMNYVSYVRNLLTELNKNNDVRLSDIYHVLGIPFPDNYLIDYKLKKNEPVFELSLDKKLGKIRMDINVPDQPKFKDTGDILEYIFTLHNKEN